MWVVEGMVCAYAGYFNIHLNSVQYGSRWVGRTIEGVIEELFLFVWFSFV